ncbi:6816_t:CDS:2, partial [Cetraspora pellucida]
MKCWDARLNNRPTSEEIHDILRILNDDILKDNFTEIEEYTSKYIEYTGHQLPINTLDYDEKLGVL